MDKRQFLASAIPAESSAPVYTPPRIARDDNLLVWRTDSRNLWAECFASLARLRSLDDDWDGEGSPAPAKANVDQAAAWLEGLRMHHPNSIAPHAGAGTDGEVQLVWAHGPDYLELEIASPDSFDWLLTTPGQPAKRWHGEPLPVTSWEVAKLIGF